MRKYKKENTPTPILRKTSAFSVALVGLAAATSAATLAPRSARAALIVHSNDVAGEIEPCGCRNNPQGGLARKFNLIKRLQAQDPSILQLDAGDLLFPTQEIPPLLADQSVIQAEYLLRAMELAGHDAITPGEKDFAMGVATFDKLRKKAPKIRFLAANLSRRKGGGAYLEPSHVFVRKEKAADGAVKDVRIAVVGLVGESLPWPKELKATPAIAAAKREVGRLRKKADYVIVLSHLGLDDDQKLARAVPGIDAIVGAHSQSFLQQPMKVGSTLLFQSSIRNQYVGVIPLRRPLTDEGYQLVGLDPGYDSPKDAPSPMDALVKEFKDAVAQANSRAEAMFQVPADHSAIGGSGVKFQTFPHCAECHQKQYDFWRKTNHASALRPLIEKEQFKNRECLGCHTVGLGDAQGFINPNQLAAFKHPVPTAKPSPSPTPSEGADGESPFANPDTGTDNGPEMKTEYLTGPELEAFLRQLRDAKDLDSTVKFRDGDEALPARTALSRMQNSWTPVQCENCHGAAHDHPFSGTYSKKVEKTLCLTCHTPDRAPEWYVQGSGQPDWTKIEAKRAMVKCPANDPVAAPAAPSGPAAPGSDKH